MSTWFVFIVAALAVFRVTELIVSDKIFEWLRELCKPVKFLRDVTDCYFCCSVHLSLYAALYAHFLGYVDWKHFFGYWLALSGASVVIYRAIRERK